MKTTGKLANEFLELLCFSKTSKGSQIITKKNEEHKGNTGLFLLPKRESKFIWSMIEINRSN